ncbi:MAG TPA: hypothetical protein VIO11_10300 [Candidatus Methanoperedens sp.]
MAVIDDTIIFLVEQQIRESGWRTEMDKVEIIMIFLDIRNHSRLLRGR